MSKLSIIPVLFLLVGCAKNVGNDYKKLNCEFEQIKSSINDYVIVCGFYSERKGYMPLLRLRDSSIIALDQGLPADDGDFVLLRGRLREIHITHDRNSQHHIDDGSGFGRLIGEFGNTDTADVQAAFPDFKDAAKQNERLRFLYLGEATMLDSWDLLREGVPSNKSVDEE